MDTKGRIREMMNDRRWSDYKLAQNAGLSQSTISNLFTRNNDPTISTLSSICDAFGITLSQFFSEGPIVELTDEQYVLFKQWNALNDRQKKVVFELISTYINE